MRESRRNGLQTGVYLAGVITRVKDGHGVPSILNTTEEDLDIDEPVLQINEVKIEATNGGAKEGIGDSYANWLREVLKRLKLEHLNEEERGEIEKNVPSISKYIPPTWGEINQYHSS